MVNERFPYGRGVLPDYEVKLVLDELSSSNDTILDYTLQLIRDGKYIYYVEPEPEPEVIIETEKKAFPAWGWIAIGVAILAVMVRAVRVRKTNKE